MSFEWLNVQLKRRSSCFNDDDERHSERKILILLCIFLSFSFLISIDLEADSWVKLFIQECLLPQPGLATGEPDVLSPGIQKELQEQFHVYLMPNPKLDAFGECL